MASKRENIKSLFTNTRSRVIIIFTLVLLGLAITIGVFKLRSAASGPLASANVSTAPGGIQSIPGALEQTAQYAKLQQEQNLTQAVKATQTGGSAIPTIIESKALGEGVGVVGSKGGRSGVGFATLAREQQGGPQQSLWIQNLKDGSCSKSIVDKVLSQGAQLTDLKGGCSCVQLKDVGYKLNDLQQVCPCKELRAAGFNARDLKSIGYSANRLRNCGFSACELHEAGFTAQEMKDGGYSDGELKGAGFSDADIAKASGLPPGITAADLRAAGCDAAALTKLRKAGVSAAAIRRTSGCSAEQLRAAGFSAKELKDAGFSAADLKRAGFSPEELKAAGFSARDLINAGFSPGDLAKAGYSAAEIKAAGTELPPGITAADVKNAGCDVDVLKKEKEAGVSAASIKQHAGCSAQALRAAGFTDEELANAGFTADQIKAAGPLSDQEIKAAGCDPDKLKQLLAAGVTAKKIKELNGCSAQALKNAGFDAKSLLDAGFTPAELVAAGFSPKQVEDAGGSAASLLSLGHSADCSVAYLKKAKAAGISAATIKQTLGCSAKALRDAGYTAKELRDAGFTAAELKNAGFGAKDLVAAGFSPKELRDAGFSPEELKNAGLSAQDLKDAGFSEDELKNAGFTSAELVKAGFAPPSSQVAGLEKPKVEETPTNLGGVPKLPASPQAAANAQNVSELQNIISKQYQAQAEQKYQQKIAQRTSELTNAANQAIGEWKKVPAQNYTAASEGKGQGGAEATLAGASTTVTTAQGQQENTVAEAVPSRAVIKTGDILFAVIDTSINSDEPGPILATIVSGRLKGSKLIGSFNLPSNANKMIITFNTLSVPGAEKTISVQAVAIDPNTARTALASKTNHHFLMRYGALFASTFLQGFGNAIQTANTTVTIGGTGGTNDVTISSGIGQSTLENAVIGLSTVGKAWAQQAQQNMNIPTTVQVYSGTGIGVLFTQDIVIS